MNPLVSLLGQSGLTLLDGYYQTQDPTLVFDPGIPASTRYTLLRDNVVIYNSTTAPAAAVFDDADGNLVNGSYVVVVDVPGSQPYELYFTLDTVAPTTAPVISLATDSGASSSDLLSNDGSIQLESALGAGEFVTYQLSQGTGFVYRYETLAALNADIATFTGNVSVTAYTTDAAGNFGPRTTLSFIIDRDPPPAPNITPTGVHEDVTVSEQAGATNYFRYRLASADANDPVSWTDTGTTEPANLADGVYVIEVTARDLAGNTSAPATADVTVDRIATLVAPTAIDLADDTGTSATDNISKDEPLVFQIDEGATAQFLYPGETEWRDAQRTDLADGTYTVKIRQVTKAADGTITAVSDGVDFTFTLDTAVAPLVLPATINLDVWNALNDFDVSFTGYEPNAVVQFSLDGTTGWTTERPNALAAGDNFFIRQVDLAGNESVADEVTITGDETTPTPTPTTPDLSWAHHPELGFL